VANKIVFFFLNLNFIKKKNILKPTNKRRRRLSQRKKIPKRIKLLLSNKFIPCCSSSTRLHAIGCRRGGQQRHMPTYFNLLTDKIVPDPENVGKRETLRRK
jgi:hypothetical protein